MVFSIAYTQNIKDNSDTRKYIEEADYLQINRDWTIKAQFSSGLSENVIFYPIEVFDLKTDKSFKSIQMDMQVLYNNLGQKIDFKISSWIYISEINEFIIFLETYVVPNPEERTERNKSVTYKFKSKEITFEFLVENNFKRISIRLHNFDVFEGEPYFWTQTQVNSVTELVKVLKQIE